MILAVVVMVVVVVVLTTRVWLPACHRVGVFAPLKIHGARPAVTSGLLTPPSPQEYPKSAPQLAMNASEEVRGQQAVTFRIADPLD